MHGLHRTYQMKTSFLGFCIGGLLASTQLNWIFLLTPFVLVYVSARFPQFVLFIISIIAGFSWVLITFVGWQSDAIPESVKPFKTTLTGLVSRVSTSGKKIGFDFQYYDADLYNTGLQTRSAKLKVACYRCKLQINPGETWRLRLRIRPVVSLHNPNGFDYRKWMMAKGYVGTASMDVKSQVNKVLTAPEWSFQTSVSSLLSSRQFPVLNALLLGDKSAMSVDDRRVINRAGVSHLFVVSGLHISLVALIVILLFNGLQRPTLLFHWRYGVLLSAFFAGSVATVYAFLSGFNTPALRALFMLLCSILMVWGQRNTFAVNYWLVALTLLLCISPLAFFDMGSWLSFGIVLSLIVGLSGIANSLRDGDYCQKTVLILTAMFRAQWLAFCIGGIILTVFVFPVSAMSLVLNFFLIPFIGLLFVPAAFLGLILASLGFINLLVFCELVLESILALLHALSGLIDLTTLPVHDENRGLVIIVFVLFLLPRVLGFLPLAALLAVIALMIPVPTPSLGGFNLIMLDVGQGSAAVVTTHTHSIVVDTGYGHPKSMGMADYVIKPYLQQKNISSLDLLFLSHDDADHAGGLEVLRPMSLKVIRQISCDYKHWQWDDVVFQMFQSPDHKIGNNGTCLLKITAKDGASVLFSGDVEKRAEASLLRSYPELLKSDVLVAPHHGSKSSSSLAFIKAVDPSVALISAGKLNHFGHPHSEVLQRYQGRLVKIYSTASHGAVEVEFSPRQEARIVSTYRSIEEH
jgi:competence protein ComEC